MPQLTQQTAEPLQVPQEDQIRKDLGFVKKEDLSKTVDPAIEKVAQGWMDKLTSADLTDPRAQQGVRDSVEGIATDIESKLSSGARSSMLRQQISTMAQSVESSPVANALVNLKVQADTINPNRYKILEPGSIGRIFSMIPGVGISANRYFTKWQSAGSVIDSIVLQVNQGAEELKRDIEILRDDQIEMRGLILRLQKVIQTTMVLKKMVEDKIKTLEADSEERRFWEEEVLYPVSKRIEDLQGLLSVNQQGVLTYEMAIRVNRELIRSARRSETITVKALEIAVVLALVLAKQKVVLKTVQAVDETTAQLMVQNAKNLRTQAVEVFKQASSQAISMDALKQCFADLDATFQEMSSFKQQALPIMANRIKEMDALTSAMDKKIVQLEKGNVRRDTLKLDESSFETTGPKNQP